VEGEPIDVLVANTRLIVPGAVDEGGDEKVLPVPVQRLSKRYEHVMNHTDVPRITLKQAQHFFAHYRTWSWESARRSRGWGACRRGQAAHPRGHRVCVKNL
jgi:inorganic pyrophosphatase